MGLFMFYFLWSYLNLHLPQLLTHTLIVRLIAAENLLYSQFQLCLLLTLTTMLTHFFLVACLQQSFDPHIDSQAIHPTAFSLPHSP